MKYFRAKKFTKFYITNCGLACELQVKALNNSVQCNFLSKTGEIAICT